jgi:hypothetical protein
LRRPYSILHPDLKTLPGQPQVQLIGNGQVIDEAVAPGLKPLPVLKHPHHKTFHQTVISDEDEKKGYTRFYRWSVTPHFPTNPMAASGSLKKADHLFFFQTVIGNRHIDAALYELNPPKVTTLQALRVPQGSPQICRYDDGTGDELKVPLGTTACKRQFPL